MIASPTCDQAMVKLMQKMVIMMKLMLENVMMVKMDNDDDDDHEYDHDRTDENMACYHKNGRIKVPLRLNL